MELFALVANEDYWLEYHGLPIWPNLEHRRATNDRSVSTRIYNNMWMMLNLAHQSDVAFAGKRGIPDEDAQPYTFQALTVQTQTINFQFFLMCLFSIVLNY